jgi:glycosyl transferase family 25
LKGNSLRAMSGVDAAFAVVLERDCDRRQHIVATLAREGMAAEIFPAVDGRALDDAALAELARRGDLAAGFAAGLNRGQIACALSHLRLLERIRERGYARALVLEDDADLVPGFQAELADRLRQAPAGFDLLYLFSSPHPASDLRAIEGCAAWRRAVYPLGTVGYVVSRQGAERILGLVKPVYFTIDDMLAEQIAAGRLAAYGAVPALVRERAGLASNIRGSLPVPWGLSAEESA